MDGTFQMNHIHCIL